MKPTLFVLAAKMVADAAQKGDLLAMGIFAYTGKMLGEALVNVA